MKNLSLDLIILISGLFFSAGPAFADSVYLRSGKVVEGRILEETADHVKIDLYGTSLTYFKEEIDRIEKADEPEDGKPEKKMTGTESSPAKVPGPAAVPAKENADDPGQKQGKAADYINKEFGFSLADPVGWERRENITTPAGTRALLFYTKGKDAYPSIGVTEDNINGFQGARTAMDFTMQILEQLKRSGVVLQEGPSAVNFNGIEGSRAVFLHPVKHNGQTVCVLWCQLVRGESLFTFSLSDIEPDFKNSSADFERMMFSLKFLGKDEMAGLANGSLLKAAVKGDTETVSRLLDDGVDINFKDGKNGLTALMLSSIAGQTGVTDLLLKKGADKNAQDNRGLSALMHAVIMGREIIAETLVKSGADTALKDNKGDTALMLAEKLSGKTGPRIITLLKNKRP